MRTIACVTIVLLAIVAFAIFHTSKNKIPEALPPAPPPDLAQSLVIAIVNGDPEAVSQLISGTRELDMLYYHETRSLIGEVAYRELKIEKEESEAEESGFLRERWSIITPSEKLYMSVWKSDETAIRYKLEKQNNEPNNAVEPTPVAVTVRADARPAPSTSAAHLGR